jgi:hypothetical protein
VSVLPAVVVRVLSTLNGNVHIHKTDDRRGRGFHVQDLIGHVGWCRRSSPTVQNHELR